MCHRTFINIEDLYCCSIKNASLYLASAIIGFQLANLILVVLYRTQVLDFGSRGHPDWVFYSDVALIIMQILAAMSCFYGVLKRKSNFIIPILNLIPVGLLIEFIFLVIWFSMFSFVMFIITFILGLYAWLCFYAFWEQLREGQVDLDINLTMTMGVNYG